MNRTITAPAGTHGGAPLRQPISRISITLVLLLAAALRIDHITQQSIWFDEAFAWNIVIQHDMFPRIAADTHPPLYYVLLRGWVTLAGDSALALRYLSALISLFTVAFTYQVARLLCPPHPRTRSLCGSGRNTGIKSPLPLWERGYLAQRGRGEGVVIIPALAALLLALTDAEIALAQEARNYALYSCLAALSMWLYLRWLRVSSSIQPSDKLITQPHLLGPSLLFGEGGNGGLQRFLKSPLHLFERGFRGEVNTALLWTFSTTALMYTHYQGVFIPALQGLHALLFLHGRRRVQAVGFLALSGVLFAPWFIGVTIPQAKNAIDNSLPFAIPSNWETFLLLRDQFLGAMWPLLAVLMGIGVYTLTVQRQISPDRRSDPLDDAGGESIPSPSMGRDRVGSAFLVSMWLLLPFGVLFFGNYFAALLTERKLLIITPAIALLTAFGLGYFDRLARWVMTAALMIAGLSAVDFYREKEPWDRITMEILPYVQETDLAMVEAGVGQYPVKYYWDRTLPDGVYFSTFPFLGDYTMAPTTDWFTYYDGLLPQVIDSTTERRIGDVATAWLIFWSKDHTVIDRLEAADYQRTMTITYDISGNALDINRYDHLPAAALGSYETGMILRAAEIDPDAQRVDLWWSADTPLAADYTTSVLVLDASETVVAQKDSPPPKPATSWHPDDVIYEAKFLELTGGNLLPGEYTVVVQVYLWTPENLLNYATSDGERWLVIGTITRQSVGTRHTVFPSKR